MSETESPRTGLAARLREHPIPRWKAALLAVAGLLVVAGLALKAMSWFGGGSSRGDAAAGERVSSRTLASGGESSFLPSGEAVKLPRAGGGFPPEPEDGAGVRRDGFDDWSPVLVRGGMSFLIGFCVGYALRAFARLSAFFAGLFFIALFGLAYAGVVEVRWDVLQAWFDRAAASLQEETEGFRAFIAGSLPAAGAAAAGLFTGVKRR
ncbi:MAG: FUN14 domain-containing protein [Planctomycetota bacterium]